MKLHCSAWGSLRGDLTAFTTSSWGEAEEQALISSLSWPVTEIKEKGGCWVRRRLGWLLGRRLFTQRVVGQWHRLPREVLMALMPELRRLLDSTLKHRVLLLLCRVLCQGLDLTILMDPFQLNTFYNKFLWFSFFLNLRQIDYWEWERNREYRLGYLPY